MLSFERFLWEAVAYLDRQSERQYSSRQKRLEHLERPVDVVDTAFRSSYIPYLRTQ